MASPIVVSQSTSIVQVDTSLITPGNPAVVWLSTIDSPGTLITIRDITGDASMSKYIVVSTTQDLHFLSGGGPNCNIYTITQPYGFLTVTPKTPRIWAVTNTFAFPDQNAAAIIDTIGANIGNISTIYNYQILTSTASISSLSANVAYITTNLSVGQSTIAHNGFFRSTLVVGSSIVGDSFIASNSIITYGGLSAASTIATNAAYIASTLEVPVMYAQLSTTIALNVAGSTIVRGLISTFGGLNIGDFISTQSNLAVGQSTNIAGQLTVGKDMSTIGTLGVASYTQLYSTLEVRHNATFYSHASIASNLAVGSALSVASNLAVEGNQFIAGNILTLGTFSTLSNAYVASSLSVGRNFVVAGDTILNNLSVFRLSTLSSVGIGQALEVQGSTLLVGPVSTASTMTVGSHLSTIGNFAVGGSVEFLSTLLVKGSISTNSNFYAQGVISTSSTIVGDTLFIMNNILAGSNISTYSSIAAGANLDVLSNATIQRAFSTIGQAAFYSSVQIQGGLSVFSSVAISCNLTVNGTLTASGFSLPGSATLDTLTINSQENVFTLNVKSSTLQYGLISTLGGINMGGRFSTANVIVTGSTLFASHIEGTTASTFSNLGVGADVYVRSNAFIGFSTIASGGAYFANQTTFNCNVNFKQPVTLENSFTVNGNTLLNQDLKVQSLGGIEIVGPLKIAPTQIPNTLSNDTIFYNTALFHSTVTFSNYTSTLGPAIFWSSMQIQGSLSVFSSIAINCNLDVKGTITAGSFELPGGAIFDTLKVKSQENNFTVNISSSTLHYGLFSTSGAIFTGREISTMSSLAVGGSVNIRQNLTTTGNTSTIGNLGIGGFVQVYGDHSVRGTTSVTGVATFDTTLRVKELFISSALASTVTASNIYSCNIGASSIQASTFTAPFAFLSSIVASTIRSQQLFVSSLIVSTLTTQNLAVSSAFASTLTAPFAFFSSAMASSLTAPQLFISSAVASTIISQQLFVSSLVVSTITAQNLAVSSAVASTLTAPFAFFSSAVASTLTAPQLFISSAVASTITSQRLFVSSAVVSTLTAPFAFFSSAVASTLTAPQLFISSAVASTITSQRLFVSSAVASTLTAPFAFFSSAFGSSITLANNLFVSSIGVGCNAPRYEIDVSGSINASKDIRINGVVIDLTKTTIPNSLSTIQFFTSSILTSTINVTGQAVVKTQVQDRCIAVSYYIDANIGSGVYIFSSTDSGFSWSLVANPSPNFSIDGYQAIGWNGTYWLFSAYDTEFDVTLWRSNDGITWSRITGITLPGSNPNSKGSIYSIVWNGQYWLLLGNDENGNPNNNIIKLTISANGTATTTVSNSGAFTQYVRNAAWNGTLWVAVGKGFWNLTETESNIKYSYDGINWNNCKNGFNNSNTSQGRCIIWNGTFWIAGGIDDTSNMKYSVDGITWYNIKTTLIAQVYSIAWNGKRFVAGGSEIIYSDDGFTWFPCINSSFSSFCNSIIWSGSRFVAGGEESTENIKYSVDGITWNNLTLGINLTLEGIDITNVAYITNIAYSSNASADLIVGNTSFYSKQPLFYTSTNSVNLLSNAVQINNLYAGVDGVGISKVPQVSLDINGFVNMYNAKQPAIWVFGGQDNTSPIKYSINTPTDPSTWNNGQISFGTLSNCRALCFNGKGWLAALGNNAGTVSAFFNSVSGTVWSSNVASGTILNSNVNNIIWTGTYFVAVGLGTANINTGETNSISRSLDGSNWTACINGFTGQGFSVAYNGYRMVAVGGGVTEDTIKFSNDHGLTWTNATGPFATQGNGIACNGRIWVAVGNDGTTAGSIKYSYDGITWFNVGENGFTTDGINVAWNGNVFVAIGNSTNFFIKYSFDGIIWKNVTLSSSSPITKGQVTWNGTTFILVNNSATTTDRVWYSSNGINWTSGANTAIGIIYTAGYSSNVYPDLQIENLAIYGKNQVNQNLSTNFINLGVSTMNFNNSLFISRGGLQFVSSLTGSNVYVSSIETSSIVTRTLNVNGVYITGSLTENFTVAVGYDAVNAINTIAYSYDGIYWNKIISPVTHTITSVAWNGSLWIAGVGAPNIFLTSTDGIRWITRISPFTDRMNAVAWNGSLWVAVGEGSSKIATSPDGINWTSQTSPFTIRVLTVVWNGSLWVAGGGIGETDKIATSPDGIDWTSRSSPPFTDELNGVNSIAWNGSLFVAVGEYGEGVGQVAKIATSPDGINWTPRTSPFTTTITSVAWNGSLWVAGGNGSYAIATSLNGIDWEGQSIPFLTGVESLTWNGSLWIAGGGDQVTIATSYNGIDWTPIENSTNFITTTTFAIASRRVLPYVGLNFVPRLNIVASTLTAPQAFISSLLFSTITGSNIYVSSIETSSIVTRTLNVNGVDITGGGGGGGTTTANIMASTINTKILLLDDKNINTYINFSLDYMPNISPNIVAVGDGPFPIVISYDNGLTWVGVAGSTTLFTKCHAVAWNGTYWLAAGEGVYTIARSSDGGVTWTGVLEPTALFFTICYTVAWNGNVWVAGGEGGTSSMVFSSDGNNWQEIYNVNNTLNKCRSVAWNGSMWVAVGELSTFESPILYSTDPNAVYWTRIASIGFGNVYYYTVAWSGTRWVIGGKSDLNTSIIAYSANGVEWFNATGTHFTIACYSVAWNGSYWIAGGEGTLGGNTLAKSTNGIDWSPIRNILFNKTNTVAWNGSQWIVGGGPSPNSIGYSADGINWYTLNNTNTQSVFGNSGQYINQISCTRIDNKNAKVTINNKLQVLGDITASTLTAPQVFVSSIMASTIRGSNVYVSSIETSSIVTRTLNVNGVDITGGGGGGIVSTIYASTIGIGTTTPESLLSLYTGGTGVSTIITLQAGTDGAATAANVAGIRFLSRGGGGGTLDHRILSRFETGGGYGMSFMSNDTVMMRIDSPGNTLPARVGINTATPTVALDVVGDIKCSGTITGTVTLTKNFHYLQSGTSVSLALAGRYGMQIVLKGGGGGGGGGIASTGSSQAPGGGGGGEGDCLTIYITLDNAPDVTVNYTIGGGGSGGGGGGGNGVNGGDTTITYNGTTYTAKGGRAGRRADGPNASAGYYGMYGAGGGGYSGGKGGGGGVNYNFYDPSPGNGGNGGGTAGTNNSPYYGGGGGGGPGGGNGGNGVISSAAEGMAASTLAGRTYGAGGGGGGGGGGGNGGSGNAGYISITLF